MQPLHPTPHASRYVLWLLAATMGLLALAILEGQVLLAWPGYLSFTDCVPYIIQSHIFADGRLSRQAPPPELSDFFDTNNMVQYEGREFSRQPPGGPAVFAPLLLLLGDIRYVPPVISTIAIAFTFGWARLAFGRWVAVLACVLCFCSVLYLRIASSALSYAPSGCLFAAALFWFVLSLRNASAVMALLCGLSIGFQFTARPFSAVLAAFGLVCVRLLLFRHEPKLIKQAFAFGLGLVPGVALFFWHNWAITSNVWPLAFSLYDPNDRLGFGIRGLGETVITHTPGRAAGLLLKTSRDLFSLFLFPLYLCLVPLFVWLLGSLLRRNLPSQCKIQRWDAALLVLIAVNVAGHMLYWCPRTLNYFEVYPLIAALLARGVFFMVHSGCVLRGMAAGFLVLAALGSTFGTLGMRAESVRSAHCIRQAIQREHQASGPLLVFLRPGGGQLGYEPLNALLIEPGMGDISSGLFNVSRSRGQPLIYAIDRGPDNARLARAYPDHAPRRLRAVPITDPPEDGPSFRIVLTPLSSDVPASLSPSRSREPIQRQPLTRTNKQP